MNDYPTALGQPLDLRLVKRNQKGFAYLATVDAITAANEIFGFYGWSQRLLSVNEVQCEQKPKVGADKTLLWYIGYTASVEVALPPGTTGVPDVIVRQGVGFGQGQDLDLGKAHESAIKEAASDALKRALKTFGNQFGLCLDDKDWVTQNVAAAPKNANSQRGKPSHQENIQAMYSAKLKELDWLTREYISDLGRFNDFCKANKLDIPITGLAAITAGAASPADLLNHAQKKVTA